MMKRKRGCDEDGIYLRTRRRRRIMEYKGNATIQDIPVEIMWKIFDYIEPNSYSNLRNISSNFSKTLTVMFYHFHKTIPCRIMSVRNYLYDKLYSSSVGDESDRLDTTKSLLYLDWLETELVIISSILWEYNVTADSPIFSELWSVLLEICRKIRSLTQRIPLSDIIADVRVLNPASSLPLWSLFIDRFDSDREKTLGKSYPFEVRVIDILTCCPSSNLRVVLKSSPDDNTVDLKAYFQIQDSCSEKFQPTDVNNDEEYEIAILKFLRLIVRTRNSIHTNNVYDEIRNLECRVFSSFLSETDRNNIVLLLEDGYRRLVKSPYEPLLLQELENGRTKYFTRRNTYNVSNNFLECSLQKNCLNPSELPLITKFPKIFSVEKCHSLFVDVDSSILNFTNDVDLVSSEPELISQSEPPFKLRIFYKKWWEEVSVMITKDPRLQYESAISFSMAEDVQILSNNCGD